MQINKIQYRTYNPQFGGIMKFQDFTNGGKITKFETTLELDKGFAQLALKNMFDGNWADFGKKKIERNKLGQYIDVIRQTLGIKLPRVNKESVLVELKHFDNGYSIKSDNEYQLTHIREDQLIWD